MDDRVKPDSVRRAELQLLMTRLEHAKKVNRGINLHRKEVALAEALLKSACQRADQAANPNNQEQEHD